MGTKGKTGGRAGKMGRKVGKAGTEGKGGSVRLIDWRYITYATWRRRR
jgi:hypothetical protein